MSDTFERNVLVKLELPVILDRLADRCRFAVAAERAREIIPSTDPSRVQALLDLTTEAVDLVTNFPDVTIGGARDVRDLAVRAEKGARLQPTELLLVLDMISAGRTLRRAFFRLPEADVRFRKLAAIVERVADLGGLETDLNRSISPRGEVLDSASDELGRVRRAIRIAHSRLTERLNSMLSGGRYATAIQDAIITTRDGRYVIPIKSEARGQIPGVVHDTSSSGQTLFIEPLEVVELNNKWREEQIAEQREVDRILDALSDEIGKRADAIVEMVEAAAEIDLTMAKALLAFDMRASRPRIWTGGNRNSDGHGKKRISLLRARHPLLDPATVVPLEIEIGGTYRVLLITGPNTGGKTVALKTVGLLALMAQSGLYIPADDRSTLSIFPAVFVDIGDEQSIAQSLSTFSSHMRNVIDMLRRVTPESLVLLDELGAGTDPQEGSALARAIISALIEKGPLVIATTHYSEVKAFAYATPAVENASVEFDLRSLAPTYRLTIGVPGRSNAIAIARRLGMPRDVLDRASALVDPTEIRADALLEDIRRRRDEAESRLESARAAETAAKKIREEADEERRVAAEERRGAREEALATAQQELDAVRQALRRLERERALAPAARESLETARLDADHAASAVKTFRRHTEATRPVAPRSQTIRPGDRVTIIALGQEGDVLSIDRDTAELQLGSIKIRQPLTALSRVGRAKTESQTRAHVRLAPLLDVPMEIDIRGQRAAEIEPILERFVNDAHRGSLPSVRIIHGKGTGALRNVVRDVLAANPLIARAELAPANEGGDGATIAYLRDA